MCSSDLKPFSESSWVCFLTSSIKRLYSIECSLKALIFLESLDNEKKTYNRIKKGSHQIEKLISKIQSADVEFISFKNFANP